jgi:glycogen debranching enzyme
MSYHNGSVWPHDNALLAMALARHGLREQPVRLLDAWFEASRFLELRRIPELVCGFPRQPEQGPTAYPLACTPQAWAAGAVFGMLQACLGLSVSAERREVRFAAPRLPATLRRLAIRDLRVGAARVDVEVRVEGGAAVVETLHRDGEVEVRVEP